MKVIKQLTFNSWKCYVEVKQFVNGGIRLDLLDIEDGCPIATCNKWIEGLKPGEIAVKDYAENKGMYLTLLNAEVIEPSDKEVISGYGKLLVCKLKPPFNEV